MPQILASLNTTVELINNLRGDTPSHKQLDYVLIEHISTLKMLLQNCIEIAILMVKTKVDGEALTQVMQGLFGKNSGITNHFKRLSQDYPHISEKHLITFRRIEEQIGDLSQLRHKLLEGYEISKVANRQLEIIRELPNIFPEGTPMRNNLEKRITLFK
jgi:hypothetical protein